MSLRAVYIITCLSEKALEVCRLHWNHCIVTLSTFWAFSLNLKFNKSPWNKSKHLYLELSECKMVQRSKVLLNDWLSEQSVTLILQNKLIICHKKNVINLIFFLNFLLFARNTWQARWSFSRSSGTSKEIQKERIQNLQEIRLFKISVNYFVSFWQ